MITTYCGYCKYLLPHETLHATSLCYGSFVYLSVTFVNGTEVVEPTESEGRLPALLACGVFRHFSCPVKISSNSCTFNERL